MAGWSGLWGPGGVFTQLERGQKTSKDLLGREDEKSSKVRITSRKGKYPKRTNKGTLLRLERYAQDEVIFDAIKEFNAKEFVYDEVVLYRQVIADDSRYGLVYGYKRTDPYRTEDDVSAIDFVAIEDPSKMLDIGRALRSAGVLSGEIYFWKPRQQSSEELP